MSVDLASKDLEDKKHVLGLGLEGSGLDYMHVKLIF
jgi:hypothetical protein